MKCHHMFAKLAKFKKSDLTLLKKKRRNSRWNCTLAQSFWKTVQQFLKMLNIHFPHDPTLPFRSIYP